MGDAVWTEHLCVPSSDSKSRRSVQAVAHLLWSMVNYTSADPKHGLSHALVRKFRNLAIQDFRISGSWDFGISGFRDFGILGLRVLGILGFRDLGILGIVGFRDFGIGGCGDFGS